MLTVSPGPSVARLYWMRENTELLFTPLSLSECRENNAGIVDHHWGRGLHRSIRPQGQVHRPLFAGTFEGLHASVMTKEKFHHVNRKWPNSSPQLEQHQVK